MAVIYEIWNPDLEVKRAVKLLRPDHTQESEERFQTEMKISAKLHHPNIVEIYAVGSWNGLPYIEMEEIEGYTVEKLICEAGSLPIDVCTSITIMVGRALNYAHNQTYMLYGKDYHGVIHRDLKPSNIMVPKDGIVKLMDFGIATPTSASIHTMEGTVVGTLQYLSPEQLEGKDIDIRVDIYSLGTVLYEMLTGVRAFPEANLAKLVPDKLNNQYTPLENFKAKIPRALRELVHRCMRHEKERRMANALDFLRALGKIHKTLTNQSPEQIMRNYMQMPRGSKTVVQMRRAKPALLPALIWTLTALSFVSAISVGVLYTVRARRAQYERVVAEMYADNLQSEQADGGPAKLEESVAVKEAQGGDARQNTKAPFQAQPSVARTTAANRAAAHAISQAQQEPHTETPQPRGTGVPQKAATVEPEALPQKPSLLKILQRKYGTENAMTIFVSEVEAGNHKNALEVFREMPKADAESKKALVYKMRALKEAGKSGEANKFLMSNDIADGEFFIEKAMLLYRQKNIPEAEKLLERASTSISEFMEQQVFRSNLLFAKGLCASAAFDANATVSTKKAAMDAWFKVKVQLQRSPEHEHFRKADEEIRRINKVQMAQ